MFSRGPACFGFLHLHHRRRSYRARGQTAGIDGAAPTFAPPASERAPAEKRIDGFMLRPVQGRKTPQRANKQTASMSRCRQG